MKLLDICQKANIKCPRHLADIEILGITSNSNEVKKDFLFVCLEGTKNDGHNYIDSAFLNGAAAVVIEKEIFACDRSVLVDDTRASLANMMNVFCGEPTKKLKFIGITGTNGKTSVSVMVKHIFDTLHYPCEIIGTLNCSSFSERSNDSRANFTTPDPEELYPMLRRMSDGGVKYVVMETSSHALKLKKLDPINFEIGIFTNLTEDHLDFHLTMEDYFKSKLELFKKCRLGIINIDDGYGKRILQLAPCRIKTCSAEQRADFFASGVNDLYENGTRYTVESRHGDFEIQCRAPGRFSIMNSMQASACALELDIDKNVIKRSFESFGGVRGRLERVELGGDQDFALFIDYAHTPDALMKLLATANSFKKANGRLILLFGCGGDREIEKRRIMGRIAAENADLVIITNDNPRSEDPLKILNDILSGIKVSCEFALIPDRRRAIEYAIAVAQADDVVLFAGKGHEDYEINARGRFPFNEREIALQAYKRLRKGG